MAESRLLGAYRLATTIAYPLAGPLISWRLRRGKEDAARIGERYGIASLERPAGKLVWLHAASVGETVSVLPLAERILARSEVGLLLTTGTVTSAQVALNRPLPGLMHQYAPLDSRRFVRRFFDHWQPGLAIFAESELWPNMILETIERGSGMALVNARMSERSFARWQRHAPSMARALLSRLDLCLAQSEADAGRLAALGAMKVQSTGNLKFDAPAPPAPEGDLKALAIAMAGRPCWLAASIHPGEDTLVFDAHKSLAKRHPGLITLVAPRHPERGSEMAGRAAAAGMKVALRSSERKPAPDTEVFFLDSIGELGVAFGLASAAFIGGSLVPHGGQNPIEAAKLDAPVLHGPHVANFAEIYGALDDSGGAVAVDGVAPLAAAVGRLLDSPAEADRCKRAAADVVKRFSGALDRTMDALTPMLAAMVDESK